MKKCYKCGEMDITQFAKCRTFQDGLMKRCRKCDKERKRDRESKIRQKVTDAITARKAAGCYGCGEKELCCLDFHHINEGDKAFSISTEYAKRSVNFERISAEIEKCVVLCANCHRKLHANRLVLDLSRVNIN